MPTVHNDTADPITIEWCVIGDHFDQDGNHTGTEGHKIASHSVDPDASLTYSDASNSEFIESATTSLRTL